MTVSEPVFCLIGTRPHSEFATVTYAPCFTPPYLARWKEWEKIKPGK